MTQEEKNQVLKDWIRSLSTEEAKNVLYDCVSELILVETVNHYPEVGNSEYDAPYWDATGDRLHKTKTNLF